MIFTMRNVPGTGDCMFLAVSLATLASIGFGGNDVLLRTISYETRSMVANILQYSPKNSKLYISKNRTISVQTLLKQASLLENLSPTNYLQKLRLEGQYGGLYGGGPELTVLSNVLRRPISIYHLLDKDDKSNDKEYNEEEQYIQCMGVFGADIFPDPLLSITSSTTTSTSRSANDDNPSAMTTVSSSSSSSAILESNIQPYGAYSWHLHILVVDSSLTEKHACVLLPQQLDKQQPLHQQYFI
jgi:OTU-like cysteine protease